MTASERREIQAISDRISRTEIVRAMLEAGNYDQALTLLEKLKQAYSDPLKKQLVQHLINDATKKRNASNGLLRKITSRFKRPR